MGDLFGVLWRRVEANARHAVDVYNHEMSEYRSITADPRARTAVLDVAMLLRRRTIELARDDRPLDANDLATFAAIAQERAEQRLSVSSQRHVIGLHTTLTLGEIHEAATPSDTDDLLRLVTWFGQQAVRGRTAYLQGYLAGLGRTRSLAAQVELVTRMLLADEPVEPDVSGRLGIHLAPSYLVAVVRVPRPPLPPADLRDEIVEKLLARGRIPMVWLEPDEFVLLTPACADASGPADPMSERTLELVRDVVTAVGAHCPVGTAVGPAGALAEALASARRISQVAPRDPVPRQLYAIADVFVELGVAQSPWVDRWLREFTARLRSGPYLIPTLDAYYRNDMNRIRTAAKLGIHPRSLDYRLQRVRELTGIDPGSSRGVRIFTAGVMRSLSGDWD